MTLTTLPTAEILALAPATRRRVERAVVDLAAGRPVLVVDDEDRENEGDLIVAAEHATAENIAFLVRHTSGVLCAPMTGADLDRLALPPMSAVNEDPKGTAYTVSVDARAGVGTGISAADRARTLRALADPRTVAADLTRPGHVFPLRAVEGGVLARRGHTEASVDLARLAGLRPAAVIGEVVADDGSMARGPQLAAFAVEHDLALLSVADLVAYVSAAPADRAEHAAAPSGVPVIDPPPALRAEAVTQLPTRHGTFRAVGFATEDPTGSRVEHVVLVRGDLGDGEDLLARVHSECLTGDVLGSQRCDCGAQLDAALAAVAREGRGAVVYLRGHEGRGIGLVQKLRAYALQDGGRDTVDANLDLGLPVDARDYADAAAMLREVGARSVRLISNNPHKVEALERAGVPVVGRVPSATVPTQHNVGYLRTKRDRMGHDLPELPASDSGVDERSIRA
jgi:3,4-dihydroxy 2-butanone 4-phosphate synthase/GTP cyclohydrolase II